MLEPLSGLQLYEKETPTQVFSREYCQIFKNISFEEHLRRADSFRSNHYFINSCISLLS